jgi:hypothetical protein
MIRTISLFATFGVLSGAAIAQSGGFGVARLAVIYQPAAGTLHAVSGVALANRTGGALSGVPKLTQAAIAHSGGFALGVSEEGKLLLVRMPGGEAVSIVELQGLDSPDRIALSPRSQAAAIVNAGRVTVLISLDGQPVRQAMESVLPASAANLAVNDNGTRIAFIAPDRGTVEIWDLQNGAGVSLPAPGVTAMQFAAGGSDLLFADASRYYLARDGAQITIPTPDAGGPPVAVASSGDGRLYFLADASGRILRVDARDLSSAAFDCSCKVTQLKPGNGRSRFQIADGDGARLVFLDWGEPPSLFSVQLPDAEVRQ